MELKLWGSQRVRPSVEVTPAEGHESMSEGVVKKHVFQRVRGEAATASLRFVAAEAAA